MAAGCTETEAEELISRSVTLFLEAREQWWNDEGRAAGRMYPLCLGAVGPYGAYLADGSEYTGNYSMDPAFLRDFHYRRMQLLQCLPTGLTGVVSQEQALTAIWTEMEHSGILQTMELLELLSRPIAAAANCREALAFFGARESGRAAEIKT